jgi:2-keto-4-pentenoate hydratase/2-oxohepta-3-ene-1,7-dioic acid hydratase in catechol pathway
VFSALDVVITLAKTGRPKRLSGFAKTLGRPIPSVHRPLRTRRDDAVRTSQWTRGRAVDTFLPAGPWLTIADEVPDPQTVRICSLVNGELMQDSTTADMIWTVSDLQPGDIIATGTPPGVGSARTPLRRLRHDDEVTVEIERLGSVTNHVVREH